MAPTNPILPGCHPDPSICCVGGNYFAVTSSFEFFPGLPIYHSTNLVDWRLIGHALNRSSQLSLSAIPGSAGVWAPTLRYHNGRFYIVTSIMRRRWVREYSPRPFYIETDDIWKEATWSDPTYFDVHGIDPDIFFDDDGLVYLSVAQKYRHTLALPPKTPSEPHLVVVGCQVTLEDGSCVGAPVVLRVSDTPTSIAEGPHMYKRDGWYYLLTAEGGTGPLHRASIVRARKPLGPFQVPPPGVNPLLYNETNQDVSCAGHADMALGTEQPSWALMLATRPQANDVAVLGRETFLLPVTWTDDGWPVFNAGRHLSLEIQGQLPCQIPATSWKTDFEALDNGWYFIRMPSKEFHSLTARHGYLSIRGNGYGLEDEETSAALLRKQVALSGRWSTEVEFHPHTTYETAGTAVYISAYRHATISIYLSEKGSREIVLRWTVGSLQKNSSYPLHGDGPIKLTILASPTTYTFGYSENAEIWFDPIQVEDLYLPRPEVPEYTGPHFALFAQSRNEPCREAAYFRYAMFEPVAS